MNRQELLQLRAELEEKVNNLVKDRSGRMGYIMRRMQHEDCQVNNIKMCMALNDVRWMLGVGDKQNAPDRPCKGMGGP